VGGTPRIPWFFVIFLPPFRTCRPPIRNEIPFSPLWGTLYPLFLHLMFLGSLPYPDFLSSEDLLFFPGSPPFFLVDPFDCKNPSPFPIRCPPLFSFWDSPNFPVGDLFCKITSLSPIGAAALFLFPKLTYPLLFWCFFLFKLCFFLTLCGAFPPRRNQIRSPPPFPFFDWFLVYGPLTACSFQKFRLTLYTHSNGLYGQITVNGDPPPPFFFNWWFPSLCQGGVPPPKLFSLVFPPSSPFFCTTPSLFLNPAPFFPPKGLRVSNQSGTPCFRFPSLGPPSAQNWLIRDVVFDRWGVNLF